MPEQSPTYHIDGQEPTPIQDKLYYLIRSRKFWATLVGITFIVLGPRAGVTQDQLVSGVLTIVAYIMGTALEDGLRS